MKISQEKSSPCRSSLASLPNSSSLSVSLIVILIVAWLIDTLYIHFSVRPIITWINWPERCKKDQTAVQQRDRRANLHPKMGTSTSKRSKSKASIATVTNPVPDTPTVQLSQKPNIGKELCSYLHRICLQNRLDGYEYCIRHILVDKNSPFRQCSYTHHQSGKRCPNAARKTNERKDSTLCPWHIKKLCLKRKQNEIQSLRNYREKAGLSAAGPAASKSFQSLLKDLEHHCPSDHEKKRRNLDWVRQDDDTTVATDELRLKITEAAAELNTEAAVGSDTDDDSSNPLITESLRPDLIESDSESIDTDHEDPLKHAGVYTPEEVSLILSEKMHRLQSLYIEQFKHLKHILREKHRKFALASVNNDPKNPDGINLSSIDPMTIDPDDEDKFRAMRKYHKYRGKEALLKVQAKEKRRAITEGKGYQPVSYSRCIYAKGSDKCDNRSLPSTHYCVKRESGWIVSMILTIIAFRCTLWSEPSSLQAMCRWSAPMSQSHHLVSA